MELNYIAPGAVLFLSAYSLGELKNGYRLGELEHFLTTSRAEPVFFSLSYILVIFPCRRGRKVTEVWSKLHYKFVIDKRCLSFTQTYRSKFLVTQRADEFGCQIK